MRGVRSWTWVLALLAALGWALAVGIAPAPTSVVEVVAGPDLEEVAQTIGVTLDELLAALEAGTFRELLAERGWTPEGLQAQLTERARVRLREAYETGLIDEARYARLREALETRLWRYTATMVDDLARFEGGNLKRLARRLEVTEMERIRALQQMGLVNDEEALQLELRLRTWTRAMLGAPEGAPAPGRPASGPRR